MKLPLQVSFHGIDRSEALENLIAKEVEGLHKFDAEGRPLAACQKPLTQYFPHDGWVEQDAEEIWLKQKECLLGALADLKLSGSALRALGITNQREAINSVVPFIEEGLVQYFDQFSGLGAKKPGL